MIASVPMLATSLPADPGFVNNLQYQITGLLVVFFTLGGMALVVWLAGKVFSIRDRRKLAAAQAEAAETAAAAPLPLEIHAAIAAAVSVTLEDEKFVIREIQSLDPRMNLAWGAEGRRSIYASKKLR